MAKRKCSFWCPYAYLGSDHRMYCKRDYHVKVEEGDPCRLNLEEDPAIEAKKKAHEAQADQTYGCMKIIGWMFGIGCVIAIIVSVILMAMGKL